MRDLVQLVANGLVDAWVVVSVHVAPEAADTIQVRLVVGVKECTSVCAFHNEWGVLGHLCKRVPDMLPIPCVEFIVCCCHRGNLQTEEWKAINRSSRRSTRLRTISTRALSHEVFWARTEPIAGGTSHSCHYDGSATCRAARVQATASLRRQQALYFLPLPQGQGSLRRV